MTSFSVAEGAENTLSCSFLSFVLSCHTFYYIQFSGPTRYYLYCRVTLMSIYAYSQSVSLMQFLCSSIACFCLGSFFFIRRTPFLNVFSAFLLTWTLCFHCSKNVIILYLFEEIYHPGGNLSILKFLCKMPSDTLKDGHKID